MFDTIDSFAVVFFSLSSILVLMVLFEKQCLALEDKFDKWIEEKKQSRKLAKTNR